MAVSGIICGCEGDYRKMTYWFAAAVLNVSVTY